MLQITITADYAIRVVLYLAAQDRDAPVPAMEIARRQQIPKPYIPKILQALVRNGILTTYPGRTGGAILNCPPSEITILQLIEAVDGPIALNRCLSRKTPCSRDNSCPAHPFWIKIQDSFLKMLQDTKLSDFIDTNKNTKKVKLRNI